MREHGSSMFIRNGGNNLSDYMVSWSRSSQCKFSPPWKLQGSVEDIDKQTFMCRRYEPVRSVGAVILLMASINASRKHQNRVINKTVGKRYRRVHCRHWSHDIQAYNKLGTLLTPASAAEQRSRRSEVQMAEAATIKIAVYGVITPCSPVGRY